MESTYLQKVKDVIKQNDPNNVLGILIDLQYISPKGYVDSETAELVAQELGMTKTSIYEILSYYAMVKTKPQAKHVLKICNSSPCHFSKSTEVADFLQAKLEVPIGETTADGLFTYHYIPCVGACEIGPVIKIKDTVFGNLNEQKIEELLNGLRTGEITV